MKLTISIASLVGIALSLAMAASPASMTIPQDPQPSKPPIDDGSSKRGGDCTNITIRSGGRIDQPAEWGDGPREFCVKFSYGSTALTYRTVTACVEMAEGSTPAQIATALGAEIGQRIPGVTVKVEGRTIDVYNDSHNNARTEGTIDKPKNDSRGHGDTQTFTEWATYGLTPSTSN